MDALTEPAVTSRGGRPRWQLASYWLVTAGLAAELGAGGALELTGNPSVRDLVAHLGYPSYFLVLLGTWKMLGAVAVLIPGRPLLKEWAYAGAFFTYTGAVVSHVTTGYALGEVPVLILLTALTVGSWALRPASRRPRRVAAAAGGDRRAATVRTMNRTASLVVRNLLFTIVVPGLGGVLAPWWILTGGGRTSHPLAWPAVPLIVAGAVLYACCVWNFAAVGRGTPGPWDAPRRVVAAGPYRWVRNPIYLAALAIVGGEAWLFMSLRLLIYAAAMAACFHLFVVGYEERALRRRFDGCYEEYRRDVPRWIPRRPRPHR